jgi:hypothetical protein
MYMWIVKQMGGKCSAGVCVAPPRRNALRLAQAPPSRGVVVAATPVDTTELKHGHCRGDARVDEDTGQEGKATRKTVSSTPQFVGTVPPRGRLLTREERSVTVAKYAQETDALRVARLRMDMPLSWGQRFADGLTITAGSISKICTPCASECQSNCWAFQLHPQYHNTEMIARMLVWMQHTCAERRGQIEVFDGMLFPDDTLALSACRGFVLAVGLVFGNTVYCAHVPALTGGLMYVGFSKKALAVNWSCWPNVSEKD